MRPALAELNPKDLLPEPGKGEAKGNLHIHFFFILARPDSILSLKEGNVGVS